MFTETRVLENSRSVFEIPGYSMICCDPIVSNGGGLISYVSNNFDCKIIYWLSASNITWESHFIESSGETLQHKILVGNIYRPPRTNIELSSFNSVFAQLTQDLRQFREVIIMSDFTIPFLVQVNKISIHFHKSL